MHSLLNTPEIKVQIDALMSTMTLAQKIGQMTQTERLNCSPSEAKTFHIGSIMAGPGSIKSNEPPKHWLAIADSYWQSSSILDQTNKGIPVLFGVDAIHGHNSLNTATIFPHNIALGAADDAELIKEISAITRDEVLATGLDWVFSPNLGVAQNNHWGRFYESFSQSPDIAEKYVEKMVLGLQNSSHAINEKTDGVIACAKHWIGDGATSHGIDHGDAKISWQELNGTHIAPFVSAINAGVMTIMASFNSWNGQKCHGHQFLLTDVLKKQLNFSGFVVSDMNGIDYLNDDFYLSIAQGVNAGIDMFMVPQNWKTFIQHLHSHVELGTVPISRINDAVSRILSVKIASGLLSAPKPSHRIKANNNNFGSIAHREVARKAVRKSLVLLKNNNILPLDKNARILVTGKNANNIGHQCGGFTLNWQGVSGNDQFRQATSIWQSIKNVATNAILKEQVDNVVTNELDLAIVVIGETPYAEGLGDIRDGENLITEEGFQINGQINVSTPYGASTELEKLHPEDHQTIKALTDKGLPVVVILISGRTLIINAELQSSSAFVAAWLPGTQGQGISDVLFGDFNFQGKLSFDWPKTTRQNASPLFPQGFGLRY